MDEDSGPRSALSTAVNTALIPVLAAISKPAQKAYLGTFLFASTSLVLLCVSTFAYVLFYYNYIPQLGIEKTIHLQFGNGHPYGSAYLASALTSLQPYDISLILHLPRSPANLAAGNFMADLSLLSPTIPVSSPADFIPTSLTPTNTSASVLTRSRRPAILTYASPIIDTASTLTGLPWYILGWKKESEILEVGMFEGVEFSKGWRNVPDMVKVVVEADEKMQFYDVEVKIIARFGGLRYFLYNYRILSYIFFTSSFYLVSVISTFLAYIILSSYFSVPSSSSSTPKEEREPAVKTEPSATDSEAFNPFSTSDFSDTSRTFPTLGRQMPLHFSRRSEVLKRQEDNVKVKEEEDIEGTTGIQPLVAEADDEDEGEGDPISWRDSGIGTSLEEGDRRGVQRRKRNLFGGG